VCKKGVVDTPLDQQIIGGGDCVCVIHKSCGPIKGCPVHSCAAKCGEKNPERTLSCGCIAHAKCIKTTKHPASRLRCAWCNQMLTQPELDEFWPPLFIGRVLGLVPPTNEQIRKEIFDKKNFFNGDQCIKSTTEIKKTGITVADLILCHYSLIDIRAMQLTMNDLIEMGLRREHFTGKPFADRNLQFMKYIDINDRGSKSGKVPTREDRLPKSVNAVYLGQTFQLYPSLLMKAGMTYDDLAQLGYEIDDFLVDPGYGKSEFMSCGLAPSYWYQHFKATKEKILAFKLSRPEWQTLKWTQREWNADTLTQLFQFTQEELEEIGVAVAVSTAPAVVATTSDASFFNFQFFKDDTPKKPKDSDGWDRLWEKK
jgi:hypothetical protein